jgi:hypothetical protein
LLTPLCSFQSILKDTMLLPEKSIGEVEYLSHLVRHITQMGAEQVEHSPLEQTSDAVSATS